MRQRGEDSEAEGEGEGREMRSEHCGIKENILKLREFMSLSTGPMGSKGVG